MGFKKWATKIIIGLEIFVLSFFLSGLFTPLTQTVPSVLSSAGTEKKDYIKWVDFTVPAEVMQKAFRYDVDTCQQEIHLNWIDLLAYLGAKYGGDFSRYKGSDMDKLADTLKQGQSVEDLTKDMKYFNYYREAYTAVLGGMVGTFEIEIPASEAPAFAITDGILAEQEPDEGETPVLSDLPAAPVLSSDSELEEAAITASQQQSEALAAENPEKVWVNKYGLKAFLPIAKNFPYNDYDDFGVARSYGYKRQHLGHDMMGQVGTPVVAVESGYVEAIGWNQYGGWRLGIRSFDQKRYYYYAHLRRNYPYHKSLQEGSVVTAGDVIGYLGRTGYSATENTNNIDDPHLHFGIQLIFDESQKEGNNEIWIDCYQIIKFLNMNRSETVKNAETKEYNRIYQMRDPVIPKPVNEN